MSVFGLTEVIDAVALQAREGRLGIVVLDLDSTAIDTRPRQHRILRDFAAGHGDLQLSELVEQIPEAELGYRIEAPLERRGYTDAASLAALHAFWGACFFTDAYCVHDRANPGAAAFARRVFGAGGLVYYLTGRPEQMAQGTLQVLCREGFPILSGRAVLHMKPDVGLGDHGFKRGAMKEIGRLGGRVVATFENEPAHAAAFLEAFPRAVHFLVGDIRSPQAPEPHPGLVAIPSFHG
ncbi:MAG TPA: hypothetical protein ENK18_23740 [Deltaproteobacteria bacterium]|nr:hypothetical protein [Deltaproteobacteria bacterium]